MTEREIARRFDLHRPTQGQGYLCDDIRAAVKKAAEVIVENTPANREQSLAVGKLEEALFFAIGAVVRPDAEF